MQRTQRTARDIAENGQSTLKGGRVVLTLRCDRIYSAGLDFVHRLCRETLPLEACATTPSTLKPRTKSWPGPPSLKGRPSSLFLKLN